jgi:hypothetical protein
MADQIHKASSELSALIPEVWSQRLYDVLLAKLPFNGSISRDYEGEIRELGDTVRIQTIPEFDQANELAEGAKADADAVTVTTQSLVINKRLVKDFICTKKGLLQSIEHVDKLREHAVYAIMKKMQSIIIANISPSASAPDHQIAFDSGTTLALADILEAKELLDSADVPSEMRKGISGVAQMNDLFNISGFTSRDFIPAGSPVTSGEFATPFLGFEMDMTSELGNVAYFFHPTFMTLAVQQDLDVQVYDLGNEGKRASRVNTDLLFGLKQLGDDRVVSIS